MPVSSSIIPHIGSTVNKIRPLQHSTIDARPSSNDKKIIKSFRSRNVSVDKIRPSTSDYQSSIVI